MRFLMDENLPVDVANATAGDGVTEPDDIESRLLRMAANLGTLSEAERDSLLAEAAPWLRDVLEELVALPEAERQTWLAELVRSLEDESPAYEAEPVPGKHEPKLGKIERFLILFVARPTKWPPLPGYEFHSRSCALQTYFREAQGMGLRRTRNVRQLIPPREYNSLQVRFTRAMQSVESKGYIETYIVAPSRLFVDRGRGPEAAEEVDGKLVVGDYDITDDERARIVLTHVCCSRNRKIYRLTGAGRSKALSMRWAD